MMNTSPPIEMNNKPGPIASRWFYIGQDEQVHGPSTPLEMFGWVRTGFFNDSLMCRTENDDRFYSLAEWSRACGNRLPFVLPVFSYDAIMTESMHQTNFVAFQQQQQGMVRRCQSNTPSSTPTPSTITPNGGGGGFDQSNHHQPQQQFQQQQPPHFSPHHPMLPPPPHSVGSAPPPLQIFTQPGAGGPQRLICSNTAANGFQQQPPNSHQQIFVVNAPPGLPPPPPGAQHPGAIFSPPVSFAYSGAGQPPLWPAQPLLQQPRPVSVSNGGGGPPFLHGRIPPLMSHPFSTSQTLQFHPSAFSQVPSLHQNGANGQQMGGGGGGRQLSLNAVDRSRSSTVSDSPDSERCQPATPVPRDKTVDTEDAPWNRRTEFKHIGTDPVPGKPVLDSGMQTEGIEVFSSDAERLLSELVGMRVTIVVGTACDAISTASMAAAQTSASDGNTHTSASTTDA